MVMTDTAPIRVEEGFDEAVVASYLREATPELFGDGGISFDQFPGGAANLTYRAVAANGAEFVLRRAPLGEVAKGGHDMSREHRVLSRLWRAYPLAPRAFHYCDDPAVMGKPFFIMERRNGVVVRRTWPESLKDPAAQRTVAESLVDGLADLHGVDPAFVGLNDLGKPEGFVSRQIEGWTRRWHAAATRPVTDMEISSDLLKELIPPAQRVAILHNDYKLDNTMVGDDGSLVAVFDWDMSTRGDPLVDAGTLLAYWAQPGDATYPVFGDRAVAIGDVMPKSEVRERYGERTGLDLTGVAFYEALALFRIAVIIEQIYARYVAGQTTDERFGAFEPIAPSLAKACKELLTDVTGA
jgi:aminoglycoside phosphotransferase (APT) family kinase protein